MKKSIFILYALTISSFLYLDGCVPPKPVQIERTIAPDRLIKRLEANRRKIKSFTGNGTISIKTSALETKSSFEVELKKPDSVKVSFFGPFGIDLAYALITKDDFQFYDVINNTVYKGKQRPGVMKEIMKVDIPFDDLLDLITGSVNLTERLRGEPDSVESTDEMIKLSYTDTLSRKSDSYFVQNDKLEIRQYLQNSASGKNLTDTKFSNFNRIDEIPIPMLITFNDFFNNQKIQIEYKKFEINQELGNLKIEIPSDAKIIVW